MNLNHNSKINYILLFVLTLLSVQLSAIRPVDALTPTQKKERTQQDETKQRKDLSFKQKASLFILKKLAAKKSKQASKNLDPRKDNRIAIASFVAGILGILIFPITIVLSIVATPLVVPGLIAMTVLGIMAVVLAGISKKKMKLYPDQYEGKTMSTIGLVMGLVILSFWVAFFIAWLDAIGFVITLYA